MRKFKDLEIWILAKSVALDTYKVTKQMPLEEQFGFTSQMRRAAVSIPSNISEGCSRSSNKEFVRFLEIAIGSAFELETQLILSLDLKYIKEEDALQLIDLLNQLQLKINAFIKSVKKF
ncbi:MAG: four helix bundle protein [Marinoscillum sp.]|uniref:four helix bundle protein n=1 Tax=Marinoscillum sp. TaxID=2024838 RepID=UPI0032FBE5A5